RSPRCGFLSSRYGFFSSPRGLPSPRYGFFSSRGFPSPRYGFFSSRRGWPERRCLSEVLRVLSACGRLSRSSVICIPSLRTASGADLTRNGHPALGGHFTKEVRRCPTLPQGPPCSTIGAERLSFRVRNGTGRF